jgi:hypothetical protein
MYEESNYWVEMMNRDATYSEVQHQQKMVNLTTETEYKLVEMLKPSIYKDGDQWCVLYGEDLQDGVAGFGETPYKAVLDFNRNWDKNKL